MFFMVQGGFPFLGVRTEIFGSCMWLRNWKKPQCPVALVFDSGGLNMAYRANFSHGPPRNMLFLRL